jgi:hypothetical protein
VDVDGEVAHGVGAGAAAGVPAVSIGHTSTGRPGRIGSPLVTRASALKTSRSRLPML